MHENGRKRRDVPGFLRSSWLDSVHGVVNDDKFFVAQRISLEIPGKLSQCLKAVVWVDWLAGILQYKVGGLGTGHGIKS